MIRRSGPAFAIVGRRPPIRDIDGNYPTLTEKEREFLREFRLGAIGVFAAVLIAVLLNVSARTFAISYPVFSLLYVVSIVTFLEYTIARYPVSEGVYHQSREWRYSGALNAAIGATGILVVIATLLPNFWFLAYAVLTILAIVKEVQGSRLLLRLGPTDRWPSRDEYFSEKALHEEDTAFYELGQAGLWVTFFALAATPLGGWLGIADTNAILIVGGSIALVTVVSRFLTKLNRNLDLIFPKSVRITEEEAQPSPVSSEVLTTEIQESSPPTTENKEIGLQLNESQIVQTVPKVDTPSRLRVAKVSEVLRQRDWTTSALISHLIALDYETILDLTEQDEGTVAQWAPLLESHPEFWRLVVTPDFLPIAYWHYLPLKEETYQLMKAGRVRERDIPPEAILPLNLRGDYKLYFVAIVIHPRYEHERALQLLVDDLLRDLARYARERDVFVAEICTNAFTSAGESLCLQLGMTVGVPHAFRGRMYSRTILPLPNGLWVSRHPTLARLYSKHFNLPASLAT